jgi:hypothetical protein
MNSCEHGDQPPCSLTCGYFILEVNTIPSKESVSDVIVGHLASFCVA